MGCVGFGVFSLGIDYFLTDADPRDKMRKEIDQDHVGFLKIYFSINSQLIDFGSMIDVVDGKKRNIEERENKTRERIG